MTDTTTVFSSSSEVTETTVTDSLEVIISSAINSNEDGKDKLSTIMTAIGDKLVDMLPSLGLAIFVFLLGFIITKFVLHIFRKCMRRANADPAAEGFLTSILKILLYIVTFIITLSILNIPMTSLIAVLSAAGLAIGLALQNSLSNLAGGFIILFSKPFKSGDYVNIGSSSGKVEKIEILYTKIVTDDNKTVYIPNGTVANSDITNFSEKEVRRVDLEFGISYDDDLENAKKIILDIAANHNLIIDNPSLPFARLGTQAEDSLQIKVHVWTKTENYWQVKYDMTELVNDAFIRNNITIPFRQLDIHIQNTDKI